MSDQISKFLNVSVSINSIDKKKDRENSINDIINLLSNNPDPQLMLPEIKGDETIQIGMSFIKYGDKVPFKNYMLTLKGCDTLSDCETICFKHESDLLLKFRDIINHENPDIITGWNIDGFDTPSPP